MKKLFLSITLIFFSVIMLSQGIVNVSPTYRPYSNGGGGTPPESNYPDSLVAYWSFEESSGTVIDSIGTHNSSTVGAGVSYGSTGILGNCLSFSGATTAYITIAEDEYVQFESSDMTFGGWFYRSNASATYNMFGGENGSFALAITPSAFFLGNTGIQGYNFTTSSGTAAVWQFVAISFDSDATTNNATLYFNGTTETITANFDGTAGAGTIYLGQDGPGVYNFNGLLDELFIFKGRALTTSELDEIYNSGSGSLPSTWSF